MKSKLLSLTIILLSLILSSCSLGKLINMSGLIKTDSEIVAEKIDIFTESLINKDKNAIMSLFSERTISEVQDFDSQLNNLLDFFKGEYISRSDDPTHGVETVVNCDEEAEASEREKGSSGKREIFLYSYDIETTEGIYRIAIREKVIDTYRPDDVGIISLYIINGENTEMRYTYWGDGKNTRGINIVLDKQIYK